MSSQKKLLLFAIGAVLLQGRILADESGTNILAYDGFRYEAGANLAGQNGGSGWSNAWVDVGGGGGASVSAGNLNASGNGPAGFDARSASNSVLVANGNRVGRRLDTSTNGLAGLAGVIDANGRIGADGKTVYVSFLQQPSSAVKFHEFEFHRNNLGDPGRIAGIGNDASDSNVYLRSQVPAGVNSTFWNLGVGNTNVNFYVVRIDFKAGSDDVYIYHNPTADTEPANEPVLTMPAMSDMSFDGVSLAAYDNGISVRHDEIRVGLTWASVLGNPPVFVVQPTNQSLHVSQAATLVALAQSSLPLSYQWYQRVNGSTNLVAGQTNASLTFASAQPSDAGDYFVVSSNGLGTAVSSLAKVTIEPISVILNSSQYLSVGPGSNLLINASVSGAAPITLQWYKDGALVAGANGASLGLGGNGAFDAGQYVLVAGNAYGTVTSSVVNVSANLGGLLAYEGFGYGQTGSDIGGANGGFGWAGAWVNVNGNSSQSYSNSLAAGLSAPTGYDSRSFTGYLFLPNSSRKGRNLDCSANGTFAQQGYVDGSGNIGADGKTLYFSFLQKPSGTSKFYEFELHRNDLGDGGRMGGIGNDTDDNRVHLRVQSPAGGGSTQYDLGAGNTNVNLYVVRIDFKVGNDNIFVYRNPTSSTEPLAPTLIVSNAADMSFDGVSLAAYENGISVSHDEVRVGMTWADVVGNTVGSQLLLAQRTSDTSSLLLAASPNYTYQMQASAQATGPWTNIGAVVASGFGIGQLVETNSTSSQRFYRATNGAGWLPLPTSDVVFADFEQPTYGAWSSTGTAFGPGPAQGGYPYQGAVSGYVGSGLVDSYFNGDDTTGTLTSPPFVITKPYLIFLIGGGNHPGQTCMNLVISNVIVKTATGLNNEALTPRQWDISVYIGQTATLQIVDSATGSWGHVNIDQIAFSDSVLPPLTRTMLLTNKLINLPFQFGAPMRRVTVTVNGQPVRDFDIGLATTGKPDWWAFVDISAYSNQMATLSVSSVTSLNDGFYSIVQGNEIVGGTNLYQETLRPQLHFSTKRGWLNDANGMIYHNGKYHLYYQHNPFNWLGFDQKYWGHAVSTDMVNWVELETGLYPHSYGDWVWSGSADVDVNNTAGFKTGTNDVIVAAFTSTARGECIAYSNDGGLTFTDFTNNPVVVHGGIGRDPHILWYAPSNYWVMAVYDEVGGPGIQFYTSPNLKQWTYRSKIMDFFECPDFFAMPLDGNTNNMQWVLYAANSDYMVGQFNGVTFMPSTAKLPGNSGADFYAAQTFTTMPPGDTRRVRIGWAINYTPGMPFNQMMYFPTEMKLKTTPQGMRIFNTPITEITNNTATSYTWTNHILTAGSNPLAGIRGTHFHVKAQFSVGTAQTITFGFQNVTATYNVVNQQIACSGVTRSLAPVSGAIQIEIIVDRETIEIFGNNGELYMPLPANNPAGNSLISLTCTGGNASFSTLTVNKLKSIWTGSTR